MKPVAESFHFCGHKFDAQNKSIVFDYKIEFSNRKPLEFQEKLILPKVPVGYDKKIIEKTLQSLELILGISYYKLYCPSKIVTSFELLREQAKFWDTVYKKGLGEFLYQNKLSPKKLAKFPYSKNLKKQKVCSVKEELNFKRKGKERILLGIGGGKDSIVAAEMLKKRQKVVPMEITSFLMETQRPDIVAKKVANRIGKSILNIERKLDTQIFEEHEGSYNGHIPISAIIAFVGFLSAALYEYDYVVVANEYSSNFGNVDYCGEKINHQWSKSVEFEKLFQEYTRRFITTDIQYFSIIRLFHEIRVAKMFAESGVDYFNEFTSCNRNFKAFKDRSKTLWCGECPKCAFVFLMLAPFIEKNKLIKIFGKNILDDKKLISLFNDLLGLGEKKPFDCVGTFEEVKVAFNLAQKDYEDDIVMKTFSSKMKASAKSTDNVFKTYPTTTLPTPFLFLGIESVGILGYGQEGKITEKYLKKNYPNLKIGILDESIDKNYLAKQAEYDLIVKTPGIPKDKVTRPYTTATNIFFSENKNLVIGVTGSKGKSTTVSLIYEIIKASGKKVRLLGNIGKPMLEVLLEGKNDPEEIFVLELSSYMLDDIKYSPNIAVQLNLFPDHLNYHGGFAKYQKVKENIFKFQKEGGIAIKPPFKNLIKLNKKNILLKGRHNLENIKAAVQVVKTLKIKNSVIEKVVKKFKPLKHRLEFVGEFQGIEFYDDANATTPEATIEAIKTLKNVDTIFLGGEDRGYDFEALEKTLHEYAVRNIVLFPETGSRMIKSKKEFNIVKTESLETAVKFAYQNTAKNKICLLSMASPSYFLWKNFEEKGSLFQELVRKLGK
jgi:UDP-N-acetylmuramoylalanine--D-glutamate ligase